MVPQTLLPAPLRLNHHPRVRAVQGVKKERLLQILPMKEGHCHSERGCIESIIADLLSACPCRRGPTFASPYLQHQPPRSSQGSRAQSRGGQASTSGSFVSRQEDSRCGVAWAKDKSAAFGVRVLSEMWNSGKRTKIQFSYHYSTHLSGSAGKPQLPLFFALPQAEHRAHGPRSAPCEPAAADVWGSGPSAKPGDAGGKRQ